MAMTKPQRKEFKDAVRVIEDYVPETPTDDLVGTRRILDELIRAIDKRIMADAGKGGDY